MQTKTYSPTGFNVLIMLDEYEEKTASGIIVTTGDESKREQGGMNKGTVLAFGPTAFKGFAGCESPKDWGVKVGDRVTFEKHLGIYPNRDEFPRLCTIPDSGIRTVEVINND